MKYASVCSGVEAASLAWMPLGWEPAWFSEIEPFPCAVLKERFPNVPNLGDMTKINGKNYRGTVDLLVGGTPCQGFSVAGKQGGLDDPRSALCLAYCRLLETMRPAWFVWENVPGVFSTNKGDDFRSFLRKIDAIGYSCAWRVLDAQYVRVDGYPRAVPQRRRRVFLVGHSSGDWRYPASVLFEPDCLPGDTPPRRIKGEGVAPDAKGGIRETGNGVFWNGNNYAETLKANCDQDRMPDRGRLNCVIETGRTWDLSGVNPTLNQCGGSGTIGSSNQELFAQNANGLVIDICTATGQENAETALAVRRLTPIECERLMGFPDNHTRIPWRGKQEEQCPDGPRYKACGNSMAVNCMRWIGMRIEYVERRMNQKARVEE